MKMSLKKKQSIMFFLFITIPLVILGAFSYINISSSMQNTIEQQLATEGTETAKIVNQSINCANNYIETLSLDGRLASIANGDNAQRKDVFNYLATLQKENSSNMELLAITDSRGKEILNNTSENVDIDLSSRDYIKQALSGKSSISDVLVSKTTGNTVIAMAYPLKINDKIVGTVLSSVQLKSISSEISSLKIASTGYAYMVDKNGLFVCHPQSKLVLKSKISDQNVPAWTKLFNDVKSGKTTSGYYTYNGVKKYTLFVPVSNWYIALTAPYNEYMSSAISIQRMTIIIIILCSIIGVIVAYFICGKLIIDPIGKLEKLMNKAGSGDYTVKANINTGDEMQVLGDYFNKMVEGQNNIISNIRNYADELAASSEEISASTEEISAATEEISANIQEVAESAGNQNSLIIETSEALIQLSSLVQIAQSKAVTAREKSEHTMETANMGRNKVEKTVDAIQNISKASNETEKILKVLEELSKKVNGIIVTINSISEQTNLLALNAAIEAARAGEHGRGFTVVADEVRKLSEQTNAGANEVSTLINEMTTQIQRAVESMNLGKEAVENGVLVANDTDKSFITIISAVEEVVQHILQIVDVTKDETASSGKIVKLIDSVASITEATASNSEQVAAAAEEQTATIENVANGSQQTCQMAENMDKLIRKYKVKE